MDMKERGTAAQRQEHVIGLDPFTVPAITHTIAQAHVRDRVVVEGTVGSTRSLDWAGGPVTEVRLVDGTDLITLAFFGGRRIGGIVTGSPLVAAGTVVDHHGRRILMNPQLWLRPARLGVAPAEPAIHDVPPVRRGDEPLVPALLAAH